MKNAAVVTFVLIFSVSAYALELRGVYLEQNHKDVRLELEMRDWWKNLLQGSLTIPVGTQVQQTTGSTSALGTNLSLRSSISIELANSSAARLRKFLAFLVYFFCLTHRTLLRAQIFLYCL
jgi:hypothetical protein